MIEKVYRLKATSEAYVAAIICNQCGHRYVPDESHLEQDFHHFRATGGYCSSFPPDMTAVSFSLCGACLKNLVEGFQVRAHLEDDDGGLEPNGDVHTEATHSETGDVFDIEYGVAWRRPRPVCHMPEDFMLPADPEKGVYRHFKGGFYEVISIVIDIEKLEPLVLYRPLYGESKLVLRPVSMWCEQVDVNGNTTPRFQPLV